MSLRGEVDMDKTKLANRRRTIQDYSRVTIQSSREDPRLL